MHRYQVKAAYFSGESVSDTPSEGATVRYFLVNERNEKTYRESGENRDGTRAKDRELWMRRTFDTPEEALAFIPASERLAPDTPLYEYSIDLVGTGPSTHRTIFSLYAVDPDETWLRIESIEGDLVTIPTSVIRILSRRIV